MTGASRLRYSRPLAWSADLPDRRLLVLELDGSGSRREVIPISFDVEDATDSWLLLMPDETGLDAPVCVLLDHQTEVADDALEPPSGQITAEALEIVRAALSGQPDPERLGAPLVSPEDLRHESDIEARQLRAALERVGATAARSTERTGTGRLSVSIDLSRFGLTGARAASAGAWPEVAIPDDQASQRLTFERTGRAIEITALSDDAGHRLAVFGITGFGVAAIALTSLSGDAARGRIAVPADSLAQFGPTLQIDDVRWISDDVELHHIARDDLERSAKLADRQTRRAFEALLSGA